MKINMTRLFRKQGFRVSWRGDNPTTPEEITVEYIEEDLNGYPRAMMLNPKDNFNELNIDQLRSDFIIATEEVATAIAREVSITEMPILLTGLTDWLENNTTFTPSSLPTVAQDALEKIRPV